MKLIRNIWEHWQTSLAGVLLFVGYLLLRSGTIDFADFKEYLALIPTIVLLLMRDWKK